MSYMTKLLFLPLAIATTLPAQGQDPREEIKEIARSIDQQLQEIDKLLLESSKKNQARATPKDLLQKAHERSTTAESGIDQLIEKLNEMKQRSQSSSQGEQQQQPQDQQQGQQPKDQQGQGQQNRRENQNPDFVKQPPQGQKPGQPKPNGQQQKPDQKPSNGRPEGGQESPGPGENTRGNRQIEPDLGAPNPGQGSENWGELQPYANFLKNRGSVPTKVPEQYRKYWEAYLRQKQGKPAGK
jgi:Skp family chaperone for outer membrane proteins